MRPGITLAALMLPWPVTAQQPAAPPSPPATTVDFSDPLARLAALGLPDMKGATWVKTPKEASDLPQQSHQFQNLGARLHGGAWKLAGDPPRMIGFGTAHAIESEDGGEGEEKPAPDAAAKPGLLERMLRNHAASQPPKEEPPKPGISVEEDAKRLIDALSDTTTVTRLVERLEYDSDILAIPAHCLIFAAQLHAAGHADTANRLAAAVFAAFPDATRNVDSAVGYFAAGELAKVTDSFFEKHDWKTYRDSLKALLEKYPRGWSAASGIAMLVPALDKRVAGEQPPVPSLPDITLKPEALAALGKFLEVETAPEGEAPIRGLPAGMDLSDIPAEHRAEILKMMRRQGAGMSIGESRSGLWILPQDSKEAPAGAVEQLQAMGMDGLIAFAAVAEDTTLVPVRNSSHYSGDPFDNDDDESPQQIYDSLDRPKTRGEIACDVLAMTLPRSEDDDTSDPATLRVAAVDFWKKHRTKSPIELAVLFAREGDDNQRQQASHYLSQRPDEEARQAFEKLVLGADQPSAYASVVETYLDLRKAEARGFFDAYAKVLSRELEGVNLNDARSSRGLYQIAAAGTVEKYLKKLSLKVGAVSLQELIDEALKQPAAKKGPQRSESPMAALASAMSSVPVPDCLKAIAAAAPRATPEQWLDLHQALLSRAYRDRRGTRSLEPVKLPAELIDGWRPLLAKGDELPPKHQFTSWVKGYGGSTLGEASMLVLEVAAFPASGERFNEYLRICDPPDSTATFVTSRVHAWIDGKEPPAWPDAEKVPEARQEEITTKLGSLPAAEIRPFVKALDLSERLAVAEWVSGFDEETPPPPGLLDLRDQVVELRPFNLGFPHDPAILAEFGIQAGYKVEAGALVKLAEKLATDAKARSGTAVSFYQAPMGLGMFASAARKNDETSFASDYYLQRQAHWFQRFEDADALAMVANEQFVDFWTVKDGKAEPVPQEDADSSAIESLKTHFASKSMDAPYIMISVLTREDAEKLMPDNSDEEFEEE
ncbi:hypothetical protein OKA05_18590 [Luteolibacter arcticus]|uniref:Uncharacterized protein n=1 Tax=Luteolibacter arcticus TaxID=1581411 RepID=A0ABT3GM49_9BACT|nr:hypothetical protein [Luteolibacter arcticus]MCW1924579.1 hypothetical protein [Luteolibacter arcticus]